MRDNEEGENMELKRGKILKKHCVMQEIEIIGPKQCVCTCARTQFR